MQADPPRSGDGLHEGKARQLVPERDAVIDLDEHSRRQALVEPGVELARKRLDEPPLPRGRRDRPPPPPRPPRPPAPPGPGGAGRRARPKAPGRATTPHGASRPTPPRGRSAH